MGLTKNRENFKLLVKFPQGKNPRAIFTKLRRRRGCPRSVHSRQISPFSLLKCELTAPKICNFWYKFAKTGVYRLTQFLQNLDWARGSQVCTFTPNFTAVALKMLAYSHKNCKDCNFFLYIFAPKEYIPLSNFYKIWRGGRSPTFPQSR